MYMKLLFIVSLVKPKTLNWGDDWDIPNMYMKLLFIVSLGFMV
jgi:hypothetical protein